MQTEKTKPEETERQTLSKIQELRDELRVQLHLGTLEAKKRWAELEERIREFERKEAMRPGGGRDLLRAIEKFRESFRS